jgi:hypothetical protein
VMGGGGRSSTGDRWTLDVEEGGASNASSSPRSEVGALHRTCTGSTPLLVHVRRGLCVRVVIPHPLPRARHCPWDPDKMWSTGIAMGGGTRLGGGFGWAMAKLQSSTIVLPGSGHYESDRSSVRQTSVEGSMVICCQTVKREIFVG